jgi:hypothetical protein
MARMIQKSLSGILECGGNPDSSGDAALDSFDLLLRPLTKGVKQSAVAASFCRRTPKLFAAPLGLGYLSNNFTKLAKAKFLV